MDPKLAKQLQEIKELLNRHDTPGIVILASPTHTDFVMELKASWTCAWLEEDGQLRVRSKRVDYPSAEAQKAEMERTVGALLGFADTMDDLAPQLRKIVMAMVQQVSHWSKLEE